MKLTTTKQATFNRGLKLLIYGAAGAGKTTLATTTGDPEKTLIISAEKGLLSISHIEIPVAEVETYEDLQEAYAYVRKNSAGYEWIVLDSISEIAESVLANEKKRNPRNKLGAYGEMSEKLTKMFKAFRDLPLHVVMLCALNRSEGEGGVYHGPLLPGKELKSNVPYWFDGVYPIIPFKTDEGVERRLLTQPDGSYEAKDRGGLDLYEPANLALIKAKIYSVKGVELERGSDAGKGTAQETAVEAAEEAGGASSRVGTTEKTQPNSVQSLTMGGDLSQEDAFELIVEHIESLVFDCDPEKVLPFFDSLRKMYQVSSLQSVSVKALEAFADRLEERAQAGELEEAIDKMITRYGGWK